MTPEEKQLLLIDLCTRLPYGPKINHQGYLQELTVVVLEDIVYSGHEVKPYLRPMSSMTEEEKKELRNIGPYLIDKDDNIIGVQCNSFIQTSECQDWLNEHYFDYRNLIQMGLALEAPKNMYKIWQQ